MTVQPLLATPPNTQANDTSTTSPSTSPTDVNENEFLQLLVAQIQHQDPTNPSDSTAFVTQLAQFSSLEQLVAIRTDLDAQQPTTTATQGGN